MSIVLTEDQKTAFKEITDFIQSTENNVHVLSGYAGTGKTTLTKYVIDWASEHNVSFVGIAPTHKAKKVLERVINKDSFVEHTAFTVAKFLCKMKDHGYVGSKNFSGKSTSRKYDLYIIDECSMISDRDVDDILNVAKEANAKILFIGDRAQIPNPVQKFAKNKDGSISKKDSKSFDFPTSTLTTIVRQSEKNPLLDSYTEIRKNLMKRPNLSRTSVISKGRGIRYYTDKDEFRNKICRVFLKHKSELDNFRVLTYTNEMVKFYNNLIRKALGRTQTFEVGEILMGYSNSTFIENGQEYKINNVEQKSTAIKFGQEYNVSGYVVYVSSDSSGNSTPLFFPDISKKENSPILTKLKQLGDKVNSKNSTKQDYGMYMSLKRQLYFIYNIYHVNGKIINETRMKEAHPMLFDNLSSYINQQRKIIKSEKTDKLLEDYETILTDRIEDDKPIGENERLCDRYQIIEKDVDYGYALTIHKSQGSTYERIFLDELDLEKIKDKWNSYESAMENGTKERNQLMYVGYTRPTHILYVLCSDT